MRALLIVDVQNDFCPKGALPTPGADQIVPVINTLMDSFRLVIASKDWHPAETVHFKKWPKHCVRGTTGAEFHPELRADEIRQVFLKGIGNRDDGYSAFEATNENLAEYLKNREVDELYIAGLTAEFCVKQTVLDAVQNGFQVYVIKDAVGGIHQQEGDVDRAFEEMTESAAVIITSDQVEMVDGAQKRVTHNIQIQESS